MKPQRSNTKPPQGLSRVFRTLTIDPRTEARLEALSAATGLSRGAIADVALGAITVCESCKGRGWVDGRLGVESDRCDACGGSQLVTA